MNAPSGKVTFLFSEIEDSIRLSHEYPEFITEYSKMHNKILKEAVESNNGILFNTHGNSFYTAFENPSDAVIAAIEATLNLQNDDLTGQKIKIRIGIHTGIAEWSGNKYMGYLTLARAARIMSAAYGGQILISGDTREEIVRILSQDNREILQRKNGNQIGFIDHGERRLKDVIQPIRLYQAVTEGLKKDFPALKTLDARPNNLPIQLTSFIGREEVMLKLSDLLKEKRLVTIIGTGGAGKSRIAMQTGADLIDTFPNGVFVAELASITDPSLIMQKIMNSVGIKEETSKPQEDTLIQFLKDKELLLILDNCEHLTAGCAVIAEKLLMKCSNLKIIATSREILNCNGEVIFRLPSLKLPERDREIDVSELTQYESVRLFIERSLAINPLFRVNKDNANALAQICIQLDGIPLAIELAAVKTKVLTLNGISERLDNRFRLLKDGKRTSLPRQQTLKALIDWSYELLSDPEKLLWERASVFNGGWTLESAENICSDESIDEFEVYEILQKLSEKSIIFFDEIKAKFGMLETIRHYGKEKLSESGKEKIFYEKHLDYFLTKAKEAEPELNGQNVNQWLEFLESEHANFQSAIETSIREDETEKGAGLAAALGNFWYIRGHYTTGKQYLKRFIDLKKNLNSEVLKGVLEWAGVISRSQGEYENALNYFSESLELNLKSEDMTGVARNYNNLGNTKFFQGEFEEAKKLLNESLKISREISDKQGTVSTLSNLSSIAFFQGDYEKAQEYLNECLPLCRETGNKKDMINTLISLGNLAYYKGDFMQAEKHYKECLKLSRELGNKRGLVASLTNLGNMYFFKSEFELSQRHLEESLQICRELKDVSSTLNTILNLGNVALYTSDYESGKNYYKECIALSRETGNKRELSSSLQNLGVLLLELRDFANALEMFNETLTLRKELGDKLGIANTLQNLGNVAFYKSDYDNAMEYFTESLDIFKIVKEKIGTANTLMGIGNVSHIRKEFDIAKKYYCESLGLCKEAGSKRETANLLCCLGRTAISENRFEDAEKLLRESLDLRNSQKDRMGKTHSLLGLAMLEFHRKNFQEAMNYIEERHKVCIEIGYKFGMAESYAVVSAILNINDKPEEAVKLAGAADELLKSLNAELECDEGRLKEETENDLRDKLSPEKFASLFEKGKKFKTEEAVNLILDLTNNNILRKCLK